VYLRSEGDRILFGRDDPTQPFGWSEGMEWDWLEQVLLTGVERFPWWEELGVDRRGSWWGYYGVTPDHNPIIAPHPDAHGWIDACGFSGHGVMHAPAAGLAVAEWVTDGRAGTFDLTPFAHSRFTGAGPGERHAF
jgi:sarcosine oxidase subunit beta